MNIAVDRIDLSDHDAELLAQASRLMSEALDCSEARRIVLVEEKADGSDIARLEVPPATLRRSLMVPFDRFTVVLDACTIFPMLPRDVLLTLATHRFFSPK